jgi:hypothetical protein
VGAGCEPAATWPLTNSEILPATVRVALDKAKHEAVAERIKDVIATGQKAVVFLGPGNSSRAAIPPGPISLPSDAPGIWNAPARASTTAATASTSSRCDQIFDMPH